MTCCFDIVSVKDCKRPHLEILCLGRLDAAVQELRAMYEGGSNEETQNEDLLGA